MAGTAIAASAVDGVTRITQTINTGTLVNSANTGINFLGGAVGVISHFRVYKADRKYRAAVAWVNNSNNPYFAAAAYNKIAVVNGNV